MAHPFSRPGVAAHVAAAVQAGRGYDPTTLLPRAPSSAGPPRRAPHVHAAVEAARNRTSQGAAQTFRRTTDSRPRVAPHVESALGRDTRRVDPVQPVASPARARPMAPSAQTPRTRGERAMLDLVASTSRDDLILRFRPHCSSDPQVLQAAGFFKNLTFGIGSLLSAWTLSNAFFRIPRLIQHVLEGPLRLLRWFWRGLKTLIGQGNQTLLEWFVDGIKGGAAWIGRLFTKVMDVLGFAEIMDLVFRLFKTQGRDLNANELAAARVVYGNSVPYWKVRVDDQGTGLTDLYNGIIQLVGGQAGNMIAITAFHIVEVGPGHAANLNNIVHEIGHVKQYEVLGSQYMGEAVHAALAGAGYDYNATDLLNHDFSWFNREQQCRITEHYWALQTSPSVNAAHQLVPSLNAVGLAAALNAFNNPHGIVTQLGQARAIYEPHIQAFRQGRIGGGSLPDLLWGQVGRLWH